MKKTIRDIDVKGKKCLVRVDFNVPIADGKVDDDNRITGALPTIKYLMKNGAKTILCSHLGRPKGAEEKYSLAPVAKRLKELGIPVKFSKDVIGENAKELVDTIKDGEVVLLENLRFHKEEEANDAGFCKALAAFADIYINDAFGAAHRAHASTAGVAKYVATAVSGFLIEKELKYLGDALNSPVHPFVAILGGSKVSDKIGVIGNLIKKVDTILIAGGMAYTFYGAIGHPVGNSICERDKFELARGLLDEARKNGVEILLPVDNIAAREFKNDTEILEVGAEIPDGFMGLDIGKKTVELYTEKILAAKTLVWNGPCGVFEMENFSKGTYAIAKAVAESKAVSVIGGGDSAAAVNKMGFANKVTHISTGGGASLEYMEGLVLPGIDCLEEA